MKLIDIAIFDFPNDAYILESILSAEGVQYFMNRQSNNYIYPGSGGVLSIPDDEKERVVKIIREAGFERFLID